MEEETMVTNWDDLGVADMDSLLVTDPIPNNIVDNNEGLPPWVFMEEETMVTNWDDLGVADMDSLLVTDPIPNNIVDNNEGLPPLVVIENFLLTDDHHLLNDDHVNWNQFYNDILASAPPDVVVDDRQQKDAPPDVVVDDRQQKEEDNSHKDDPLAEELKRQSYVKELEMKSSFYEAEYSRLMAKELKRQSYVKELEMKSSFYEAEYRRLMAENQALRFSLHSSKLTFNTTSITRQASAPLFLDVGAEDSNINKGEMKRKRKRSEKSISLEEISKHYGKTIDEAAKNLSVSRSTLKRICRGYGILSWPYKRGSDKSNSVLKSNQTDVVAVHASEGALTPIIEAFNEPLVTTNVSHDLTIRIEHGKQSSTLVLHQQEQTNLTAGPAQPETSTKMQFIENTTAANAMKNLKIMARYKDDTIKFMFTISDGLVKLRELVARYFQLSLESFRLTYKDADGGMILIACDINLMVSVVETRQPDDQAVIRLFVSPVVC